MISSDHLKVMPTSLQCRSVNGAVYCADAIDLLRDLGKESADVLFLDPPFNLGKRYSKDKSIDQRPADEYHDWLFEIMDASVDALRPGAALFVYHLPIWALRIAAYVEQALEFRHWISISMKNGFARGMKLYPAHYALLYFTKGPPQYFCRPKLNPLRCRSCGSLVRDYGGYKKYIETSGINLSDVWDDLSPVRHKNKKYRVANELPITIFDRILTISGKEGMTYVDPFAGSGSGALSAIKHNLNFVVGDIVQDNTRIIVERIRDSIELEHTCD